MIARFDRLRNDLKSRRNFLFPLIIFTKKREIS